MMSYDYPSTLGQTISYVHDTAHSGGYYQI